MYGLVNRAIQGLVTEKFGEDSWHRIRERASIEQGSFVAMESYDDAVTYGLVHAASVELELDPATILEAFGTYWTTYTIDEGYGDLLAMMGSTLNDFLDNLDSMHARIGSTMPDLIPPSFRRETVDESSSILHYASERPGLAPMVVGLLKGLASRFEIDLDIQSLDSEQPGVERFLVRELQADDKRTD